MRQSVIVLAVLLSVAPHMSFAQETAPRSSIYCPNLTRTLLLGSRDATTGGQVTRLQRFLSDYYDLDPGQYITGYFGSLTRSAVQKFQCDHDLACSGHEATTGWGIVGEKTRGKIASVCGYNSYAQSKYYSQGAYRPYSQSAYYSQATYYSQSSYYRQGAYYSQSAYYSQASYYRQSTYYSQSAYGPAAGTASCGSTPHEGVACSPTAGCWIASRCCNGRWYGGGNIIGPGPSCAYWVGSWLDRHYQGGQ